MASGHIDQPQVGRRLDQRRGPFVLVVFPLRRDVGTVRLGYRKLECLWSSGFPFFCQLGPDGPPP